MANGVEWDLGGRELLSDVWHLPPSIGPCKSEGRITKITSFRSFFYFLNVGTTVYMFLLTNWQLRITTTSLLILKDPFSLDTKTINTSQNTRTVRWHDNAWLAYNAVYEIGPHVHTSLTDPAAL